MRRDVFIEMLSRQIHGGFAPDDSTITNNLINTWVEPAIAFAAQKNNRDNIAIDGISYVNNSFYTTFKAISITYDSQFLWKISLPQVPVGIGNMEGISVLELTDGSQVTMPLIPLTQSQRSIYKSARQIPNKTLWYYEGKFAFVVSTLLLNGYTANVTMISGGDPTDIDSELNIPPDYIPIMQEYIFKQLTIERNVPKDVMNDGQDAITTT